MIELQQQVSRWLEALERFTAPAPLSGALHLEEAVLPLQNLRRRLGEGPAAPVRVAFFGPTGVGKSKLFNSILGEVLSPAGYRRPFTREAVYYVHRDRAALSMGLVGKVQVHDRAEWREQIFIDTPDFDGVEEPNRRTAERIYLEADLFIFITDIHKYADAATWSYLDRLRRERKRCLFVVNKVEASEPAEDFRRRLSEAFAGRPLPGPVLPIGEHPQGDGALIGEEDPGFRELMGALKQLPGRPGAEAQAVLVESFRLDLERFLDAWRRLCQTLQDFLQGLRRLRELIDDRFAKRRDQLDVLLETQLDPALKEEVYQEMLRRLERIDFLRYPRKLMSLPVQGARKLLGRYFPVLARRSGRAAPGRDEGFEDRGYPAVESLVLDFTGEVLQAFKDDPKTVGALDPALLQALRLEHAELGELYRAKSRAYREWVEAEARRTAANLTGEHKLKFILSQLIYNSVVIGVQLKTAGALSLTEILTDGVLSPLVAKAVGMAISSEQVSAFEAAARKTRAGLLAEVLEEARSRVEIFLRSLAPDLEWLDRLAREVGDLERRKEACIEQFGASRK
ncbi:MAG: GTPase domain-containing protein [Planctomycetes bacterium]|nr:GTPase domain-containing protein [Planctomycetota bacterium]